MTAPWDRAKETSSGQFAYRVSFDGIGTEWVSLEEMARVRVLATDVERVTGLNTQGLQLKESGDLVRAKWEPSGFKVRVTAEAGVSIFHRDPTAITYLNEDVFTDVEATVEVTGAEAFASAGILYIGTETIYYEARDDLSFGGLVRGLWSVGGEAAQYHYRSSEFISDARLFVPEITDVPMVFEGRRVYLHVYAPGDDLQGDGTRIWTGICSTEPTLDGDFWSWTVDPLNRLFAFDLASDLADDFGLDGAYYSPGTSLAITIREWNTASKPTDTDTVTNEVTVRVIGLFRNRTEFLDALNYILDAETSSWSGWSVATTGGVRAEARADAWGLICRTPAVGHKWIELHVDSVIDGVGPDDVRIAKAGGTAPWPGEPGGPTSTLPDTDYLNLYTQSDGSFDVLAPGGGGTFPRVGYAPAGGAFGFLGGPLASPHFYTYETSNGIFDPGNVSSGFDGYALESNRLPVNAPVTMVPGRTAFQVEWDSLDPVPEATYAGGEYTGLGDVIAEAPLVIAPANAPRVAMAHDVPALIATAQNAPSFKVQRIYVRRGNFADFLQQLLDDRAEFMNLGLCPDLRPDDFAAGWDTELRATAERASLLNERAYVAGAKIDLDDMMSHELRLLGCHAHFSLEGRIRFREVRPPSSVEPIDALIDVDAIVTEGGWYQYEPAQIGIFNQVHHSTGYDPVEDDFLGPPWNFRWGPGYSRVPGGRTLEVAPKSVDPPRRPEHDAQRILGAQRVLATFGERYAVLTVAILLELFDAVVGDVVSVTWSKLPNRSGGFGATVTARVIGRSFAPTDDAHGSLTLLISRIRYGGYAPGARCESITGTSGGTGPFDVTVDLPAYFPTDTDLTDFMQPGDEIEVYRWNHRVADRRDAVVTAVAASTLTFTVPATWSHAGYQWAWGARRASSYSQPQNLAQFAFEADRSSRINFADEPATRMVFAP